MENTVENKAKFFAQYYGQKVLNPYSLLTYTNTGVLKTIDAIQLSGIRDNDLIQLKPLSQITDEDLEQIVELNGGKIADARNIISEFEDGDRWEIPFYCIDRIRKLGFAVEWDGISITKQLEYGWIKLTQ